MAGPAPDGDPLSQVVEILKKQGQSLDSYAARLDSYEQHLQALTAGLTVAIDQMRQVAQEVSLVMRRCKVFDCQHNLETHHRD